MTWWSRPARPVLALLATLPAAACGDEGNPTAGDERADQVREAVEAAGLDDDVVDVLAAAAGVVDSTHRVTYEIDGQVVVVTQRPPDRRVDVRSADGTVDATFSVGGRAIACTDPAGDEPWRCDDLGRPAADSGFDPAAVSELASTLASSAVAYEFTVEERELVGTAARCLVTSLRPGATADPSLGDTGTLCIADTGAILLVERPAGTLRATSYSADVPDDAFEVPAGTD